MPRASSTTRRTFVEPERSPARCRALCSGTAPCSRWTVQRTGCARHGSSSSWRRSASRDLCSEPSRRGTRRRRGGRPQDASFCTRRPPGCWPRVSAGGPGSLSVRRRSLRWPRTWSPWSTASQQQDRGTGGPARRGGVARAGSAGWWPTFVPAPPITCPRPRWSGASLGTGTRTARHWTTARRRSRSSTSSDPPWRCRGMWLSPRTPCTGGRSIATRCARATGLSVLHSPTRFAASTPSHRSSAAWRHGTWSGAASRFPRERWCSSTSTARTTTPACGRRRTTSARTGSSTGRSATTTWCRRGVVIRGPAIAAPVSR